MNQSINTDSKNSKEPQQKYRLGTVSIKILGGLNRFYRRLTSPSASIMAQNIQLFGPRGGFLTHQWSPARGWTRLRFQWITQVTWPDAVKISMNVRRALPKIHFDQALYRKANTCVFAIIQTNLSNLMGHRGHLGDMVKINLCYSFISVVSLTSVNVANIITVSITNNFRKIYIASFLPFKCISEHIQVDSSAKRSMVKLRSSFEQIKLANQVGSTWVPNAIYQVSMTSAIRFRSRRFF